MSIFCLGAIAIRFLLRFVEQVNLSISVYERVCVCVSVLYSNNNKRILCHEKKMNFRRKSFDTCIVVFHLFYQGLMLIY